MAEDHMEEREPNNLAPARGIAVSVAIGVTLGLVILVVVLLFIT